MSFAVQLDSAPRALHWRLHLMLVGFALAASALALAFAEPADRGWIALLSVACFAMTFGRRRLITGRRPAERSVPSRRLHRWVGGASPAAGRLSIDDTGRASWRDADDSSGGPERVVRIERWNVLGPLAWLRLRADDGRETIDVLLTRRSAGADTANAATDDWRRLRAWLLWYGRGGTPAEVLQGAGRARR